MCKSGLQQKIYRIFHVCMVACRIAIYGARHKLFFGSQHMAMTHAEAESHLFLAIILTDRATSILSIDRLRNPFDHRFSKSIH
jgi:hypothetical protein